MFKYSGKKEFVKSAADIAATESNGGDLLPATSPQNRVANNQPPLNPRELLVTQLQPCH